VALATGCVAALSAVPAVAAPAKHVTTSWGHVNPSTTQAKPVVTPGNGRSWALRTN
jgi:hypothetical protein